MVVVVMALLGGLIALLAANLSQNFRQSRMDRVRLVCRAITESAAGYARAQASAWSSAPPRDAIELDVKQILPPRMNGTATLSFVSVNDRKICHVSASAESDAYATAQELDVPMGKP